MHERRMRDGALTIGEQRALPDPSHSHISLFPSHPLPSLPTCATSPVPGGGWISGGASSERVGRCRVRHYLAAPRPTTPPSPSPPPLMLPADLLAHHYSLPSCTHPSPHPSSRMGAEGVDGCGVVSPPTGLSTPQLRFLSHIDRRRQQ
jgi:hypothetical protein